MVVIYGAYQMGNLKNFKVPIIQCNTVRHGDQYFQGRKISLEGLKTETLYSEQANKETTTLFK